MFEQVFRFGRANHLIGIAGVPPAATSPVGVIVLNAGMVHRIGPFRLNVEMTRRLNACGYPTLRFDLSTIGDSGSSGESQTRTQQVCADVDDAMCLLSQQADCRRFVLVGLCSGAQNAHTVAKTDDKVAGVIFLDGYAFRTFGYRVRYYLPRLLDPARWMRRFTRKLPPPRAAGAEPTFSVAVLPQAVVRRDLAGMLDRGLKLYLIYSGGINLYFNHLRQFRECFGPVINRPGISTSFNHQADHTYILADDRHRLLDSVEHWLTLNFPITTADTSP